MVCAAWPRRPERISFSARSSSASIFCRLNLFTRPLAIELASLCCSDCPPLARSARLFLRSSSRFLATSLRREPSLFSFIAGAATVTTVAKQAPAARTAAMLRGSVRVSTMSAMAPSELEVDHAVHDEDAERHHHRAAEQDQVADRV